MRTLRQQPGQVFGLAFSPDGALLAAAENRAVTLWDVATGKEVNRFPESGTLYALTFSANGRLLATGSSAKNGALKILDAASGKVLHTYQQPTQPIRCVAFSPAGDILAFGSHKINDGEKTGVVGLWHWENDRVAFLEGHADQVWGVAFSKNGKMLASAGRMDKLVKLWNVGSRHEIASLPHTGPVMAVCFSPLDGNLAAASRDIRLWDIEAKKERAILKQGGEIWSLAFAPNGKMLATGHSDGKARLWEAAGDDQLPADK